MAFATLTSSELLVECGTVQGICLQDGCVGFNRGLILALRRLRLGKRHLGLSLG
jgi:hypothetical protein